MKYCRLKKIFILFIILLVGIVLIIGCREDLGTNNIENAESLVDQEGIKDITADFTVRVRNEKSQKPVENAEVKFAGGVGFTDNEGKITFPSIETGGYKLEVKGEGFLDYSFDEVIVKDTTLPFVVNLLPTKEYEILYCFTSNAKQIWTPVPVYWDENGTLDIEIFEIKPAPTKLYTDEHGNQIAYWNNPKAINVDYCLEFKIKVSEIRHDISDYSYEYDQESEIYIKYTAPDEMTQSADPRIISQAEEIVKDAVDPLKKVNKIAKWIIVNIEPGDVHYIYPDALTVLDYKKGHCGAFANIFTALCRASGIPARNVSAFHHPYEDEFQSGELFEGFFCHIIAEFYLQGYGWVQVDPIRHDIGNIHEELIIMSKGNSFPLEDASFNYKHIWFHLPKKDYGGQIEYNLKMDVTRID